MTTIKGIRARLRALLRRGAAERELDDELRFHIEMETEKNMRSGMNPIDARRRALRDFGGIEPTKEAHRDVRGRWLEELVADTRYALRTLRRAPVLATASADGTAHTVVISDRLWRDQFGADARIVGRSIRVDGKALQVVGVSPAGFSFPVEAIDVWLPQSWKPEVRSQVFFRQAHFVRAIARLAPGASRRTANAQLQAVANRLKEQYPGTNKYMGAGLTPLHEFLVGDTRLPLLVLLAAVALLLLISCANVGNLLLVRAAGREREAALRLTLGAGRRRLAKQALTESLILSVLGGVAGIALGVVGTRVLEALQPAGMLRVSHFDVDWTVVGYVVLIVLTSGLLFGTAPALWTGRRSPAESLKEGGRGGDTRRMRRWTELLVVGEVALAVVLTLGAGLLVRSFRQLTQVDPGFDPRGVLTTQIVLSGAKYDSAAQIVGFFDQLTARAAALPGVTGVAATTNVPLESYGYTSDFVVAGRPAGEYYSEITHRPVTPEYFKVMHVPIIRGRPFTAADRQGAPSVVIINEQIAQKYFKGQDPVGQRLTFDKVPNEKSDWATIVGVVRGERQRALSTEPLIEAYVPFAQEASQAMSLLTRVAGDPDAIAPAIRRLVTELDPDLAISRIRSLETIRFVSLARERFLMTMLVVFAGVGFLLAVIGVYGVLAQVARRRTREMGIRIALGSPIGRVRWLVVRHGLALVTVGLVIGVSAALLATRGLSALLYHIAPADPITFVAVPLLLALTGVAAAWIPALHASRADPAVALRSE